MNEPLVCHLWTSTKQRKQSVGKSEKSTETFPSKMNLSCNHELCRAVRKVTSDSELLPSWLMSSLYW